MTDAVPTVLVTGVDDLAMGAATLGLQWDLPDAVVVTHRIDVESRRLRRTISDVTGLLERDEVDLEHACTSCAVREDIVPTLHRLADLGRWAAIVAHLPVATEPVQVCRVLAAEGSTDVRIAAVVTALDGPTLVPTLTGDALLAEVGRHTALDDRRGLAETAGSLVEYADVVSVVGEADAGSLALVRALARPDAAVLPDGRHLPASGLLAGPHDHRRTEAWVAETRSTPLPALRSDAVWQLDLRSERPFHPDRLHDHLEAIGAGPHRSRGCFWLPTRPGQANGWDGAGGQVSIGGLGPWGPRTVQTRIVVTGLTSLTGEREQADIRTAFERCLVTGAELDGRHWQRFEDGFEPWLGGIRNVA